MKIGIITPFEAFLNDIADIVRIFFGEGSAGIADNTCDAMLTHTHTSDDTQWHERFVLTVGNDSYEEECSSAIVCGTLTEKRYLKRLIKQCCYNLLKRFTGKTPAWGSMTGIRPTRLYYQQLEAGKNRNQARQALLDIFDLSNDKLQLLDEIITAQEGLITNNPKQLDLYIGIPFCTTRCSYCSFSSGEIGDGHLVEPYLNALHHEIDLVSKLVEELGFTVRIGYMGGGTPSSLSTRQLDTLLQHIERRFGILDEFTVEAGRPDTLDEEKLRMMKGHPITRISINPQSMNNETLRRIGRAHTAEQTIEAYETARKVGHDHINMDVIAALPGENLAMFEQTLNKIQALNPECLTVHTLAIKRSSKLHEQRYQQSEQDVKNMVAKGKQTAESMGMKAYYLYRQKYMAENLENVGYAKPGYFCRYNIDNMEETTSVLALGAGGISKCVFRQEEKIVRAPNIANIEQYIERVDEMYERKRNAFTKLAERLAGV